MPEFVYGDSYGGVQGAAQAADNSDRQFLLGLIGAQQAAQRLAIENAQAQSKISGDAMAPYLQSQQLAERARQFDANLAQRQDEQTAGEDLGYAGLDQRAEQFATQQEKADREIERLHIGASEMGKPLADSFGAALIGKTDAEQALQQAVTDKEKLLADINAGIARGSLRTDPKNKGSVLAADEDPSWKSYAAELNTKRTELDDRANEAAARAKEANRNLALITASLQKSGFTPDMQQGAIIHPRTGQVFSFMNSTPIAPLRGAAKLPIAPAPPAPVQPSHWYNPLMRAIGMGSPAAPAASPMLPVGTGRANVLRYNPKTGKLE